MQMHDNTVQVVWELTMIVVGLPALGVLACFVLWVRAGRELDADQRQYQRIAFAAAAFTFAVPLIADCIRRPSAALSNFLAGCMPALSLAGVLAAITAAVLLAVYARGLQLASGALLSLLGFVYCALTIFVYAGGAGY